MPGFVPADEDLFFREKDPKPLTPCSVISDWTDANFGRADQLAESILSYVEGLKQGPPTFEEHPPIEPNSRRRFEEFGTKKSLASGLAITQTSFRVTQIPQSENPLSYDRT